MTARIDLVLGDGTVAALDQCVSFAVDGSGGLVQVPAKRGGNLQVPGMHGEMHVWAKKYGPGTVLLPMWVRGVNTDGTIPSGSDTAARLLYHANLRQLLAWFTVDERLRVRHTLTDGTAREITGEVLDVIEPTQSGAGRTTLGRFTAALSCADPFWSDLADASATVPSTGASTSLAGFAGATAPMESLQIVLSGPLTNPRLAQPSTGIFVQINRALSAGQTVTVDTGMWQVYGAPAMAGLFEQLTYGGRGTTRWFALRPGPGGVAPAVTLTATAGSGTAQITGRRRFNIG